MHNIKYLPILALLLILVYGGVLRIYDLGSPSMWIDEGFSSYSSLTSTHQEYYIHTLSQRLSFGLFGVSDFSARLPSVIFSLLSLICVYLIGLLLWGRKWLALGMMLIIALLYVDISWARQARFYSLLELLFLVQIYMGLRLTRKYESWTLAGLILTLYISLQFHIFLYSLILLLGALSLIHIGVIYERVIGLRFNWQSLKAYSLPLLTLSGLAIHGGFKYLQNETSLKSLNLGTETPDGLGMQYLGQYFHVLMHELGWLILIIPLITMYWIYTRSYEKLALIVLCFIVLSVLSFEGVMYHDRYIYFIIPFLVILGLGGLYEMIVRYRDILLAYVVLIGCMGVSLVSLHLQVFPKSDYDLGATSPQVDFKSAYSSIPDGKEVISGFPVMCEWYYSQRGVCIGALRVDFVGREKRSTRLLTRERERYTGLPYLNVQEYPQAYIIIDTLTYNGLVERDILQKYLDTLKIIYNDGDGYKNIVILRQDS